MSVSNDQRREDRRRALCLILEQLGDRYFLEYGVEPTDPGFNDVLKTTWRELLDDNLIDDRLSSMGRPVFRLTSYGWLRALILSGEIDSVEMRERCVRLARALKSVVKGRSSHYDEFVSVDTLAAKASLPEGWVFNAIESRLLGVVFPDDRWDAHMDPKGRNTVRVSPTLGLNHLTDEGGSN
jgi:hypothetical protein